MKKDILQIYLIIFCLISIGFSLNLTLTDYHDPSAHHILDAEVVNDILIISGMIGGIEFYDISNPNILNHLTNFNLYVNKPALELWNTLSKTELSNGTAGTRQDWAYLTRDWENIEYDGNNNKLSYIHRKTTYDKEAKTYTTVKEIRKK